MLAFELFDQDWCLILFVDGGTKRILAALKNNDLAASWLFKCFKPAQARQNDRRNEPATINT